MKTTLEITKATIVNRNGIDHVSLDTTLPGTMWGEPCASLKIEMLSGAGAAWVKEHFGIVAEVIVVG